MKVRGFSLMTLVVFALVCVMPLAAQDAVTTVTVVETTDTYRLVRHPLGETQVPLHPTRVATLIPDGGVDYLLTFGIVPVAAADLNTFGYGTDALPTYYDLATFPVETTGADIIGISCCSGSYNLEKLLEADPDVIIGWTYQAEGIYDQLSAIAPTVAIAPYNGPEWLEAGRVMAEVLGRTPEYDTWLATWETSITDLQARYDDPSEIEVSVVNASNADRVTMYTSKSQPGQLVTAAGFKIKDPPSLVDNAAAIEISLETLNYIDADVIFVTVNYFNENNWQTFNTEGMGSSAVWQQLKAVQAGRVYPIDTFFWTNGGPAANTQLVLPDMFEAVFNGQTPRHRQADADVEATPEATEAAG